VILLSSAESEIQAAIERMHAKPESSKPFVVVTAKARGRERFVQFYGSAEKGINFDVPVAQLNLSEKIQCPIWSRFLDETKHGFGKAGCSSREGASRAITIFLELDFSHDAVVEIEEHADGTGIA